jgi:hypothetical protein
MWMMWILIAVERLIRAERSGAKNFIYLTTSKNRK